MRIQRAIFTAVAALSCLILVNDVMAQGRRGGGFDFNSKIQILRSEENQEEIGILPEQKEDLEELEDRSRSMMRDVFTGMRDKFRNATREEQAEMMAEVRSKMAEGVREIEAELTSILVPHQMERLEQLALQNRIRREGTAGAMQNEELMEKAGLDGEDVENLKAKEEEVKKDLEEKIKKLRAEAQEEILSVLSAKKREALKSLIGEAYEAPRNNNWRGGGRGGERGGDRGGRGGGRRGGDRGGRGDF
jgi:plasmid maintenance system killer protein